MLVECEGHSELCPMPCDDTCIILADVVQSTRADSNVFVSPLSTLTFAPLRTGHSGLRAIARVDANVLGGWDIGCEYARACCCAYMATVEIVANAVSSLLTWVLCVADRTCRFFFTI